MNPTTGAMIGEYSVPTANAGLTQIVSNPADGNLWFTEAAADKVGWINPTTKAIAEFPLPTAGAAPGAIAVDRNGNVWVAESNGSRIAELSPNNTGIITEYVVPGPPVPPSPTVVSEEPLMQPKPHKKGKQAGKPVLVGFELVYSTAMNSASAGLATNYHVTAYTTRRVKRRRILVTEPVTVQARYDASTNAVILTIMGKQAFAKGGQITVNATPPDGVSQRDGRLPGHERYRLQHPGESEKRLAGLSRRGEERGREPKGEERLLSRLIIPGSTIGSARCCSTAWTPWEARPMPAR